MAQKDIHNNVKFVNALNMPTIISSDTTTNGNVVDTNGFEGVEFVIQAGGLPNGTYVPAIYQSDDPAFVVSELVTDPLLIGTTNVVEPLPAYGATTNAIADATFTSLDSDKVARIGVLNKKRYVRLSIVSTGVSTAGAFSSVALLGFPLHAPTTKDK